MVTVHFFVEEVVAPCWGSLDEDYSVYRGLYWGSLSASPQNISQFGFNV